MLSLAFGPFSGGSLHEKVWFMANTVIPTAPG